MIQIEGLTEVMHRIEDLNLRFGIQTSPYNKNNKTQAAANGNSFASELQGAMGAHKTSPMQDAVLGNRTGTAASLSVDTNTLITEAAKKYNVDPRLVAAVAQTESGGNQEAVSSAGAIGVMQLMPDTAASLGVNPYDKQQNIEGGAKYLKQMLDTFNGDVSKAVAAYNAGPQAVKNYNGIPPYKETQNYVNKVIDIYR